MQYNWVSSKAGKSLSVNYQIVPTGVDIEKDGFTYTFVTEIMSYDEWECGAMIPHTHLDTSKYGGAQ